MAQFPIPLSWWRSIRRRYSIVASIDLFGMIVVETRWDRIGAAPPNAGLECPISR